MKNPTRSGILCFIFLGFIFLVCTANAQSKKYLRLKEKGTFKEGYVIYKGGGKKQGLIRETRHTQRFRRVQFVDENGKEMIYYPSQIDGYSYSGIVFSSTGKHFLELHLEGKRLSIYKMEYDVVVIPLSPGAIITETIWPHDDVHNFYVRKTGQSEFKYMNPKTFAEVFSEYFGDCQSLKSRIENEELNMRHLDLIVKLYDECK